MLGRLGKRHFSKHSKPFRPFPYPLHSAPMPNGATQRLTNPSVLLGLLLMFMAFMTYFWNYTNPPYLYWDENYHVASAQKYLNGVYFMEPHPPLGKLLIAAGEKLFQGNAENDQFIGTDYAKELPGTFSFRGYRFFPVLFGFLIAPLFYLIFLLITRKPAWAFLLSFLYVFDNALITHSRAAMLDSTMLFFCTAMIALYLLILKHREGKHTFPFYSLLFGIMFGGVMATKALGLIMVLLWPAIILQLRKVESVKFKVESARLNRLSTFNSQLSTLNFPKISQFLVLSVAGFLITYVAIWQVHFMIGTRVVDSLPDGGYYQASEQYKTLLNEGKINLPLMMRENLHFLKHYSTGVPALNLCKIDENGSPFFLWPLGARSINYRWETPNGSYYQYITLQVNPFVWGAALLGLVLAFTLLIGSWLIPGAQKLQYRDELLVWCGMWFAYMFAVSRIDRVMYLYHYFIPLLLSFIITAYVFLELKRIGMFALTESRKNWILLLCGLLVFAGFQFYRPLTYYEPIDDKAFEKRMIFQLWELRCVNCKRESHFAIPLESDAEAQTSE